MFYYLVQRNYEPFLADQELRVYLGATVGIAFVLWGLLFTGSAPPLGGLGGQTEGAVENAARQAAFQISSLLNSTGYATSDFAQWETPAQMVLVIAMFIGGSAGSTGGGIKVIRWIIVTKAVKRMLLNTTHPDAVRPIRLGGRIIDEESVRAMTVFTILYLLVFVTGMVLIVLDATRVGLSLTPLEAISASLATLGNIGPGFGLLGPFGSFLDFPPTTKLLMTFLMWIGRLEIVPVLVLFTGTFWRR